MRVGPMLTGVLSYTPFWNSWDSWKFQKIGRRMGGSAIYCYSVWLRHLVIAYEEGFTSLPDVIAELGPGSSIGTGLAGMLSGANKYYALDVVEYGTADRNIDLFRELLELFRKREDIPDDSTFPKLRPRLKSYKFPHHILTDERLNNSLKRGRIQAIEDAIINSNMGDTAISIKYFVPWYDTSITEKSSVDMIYSQSVLEHVENLGNTYQCMSLWLKPNGYMSHEIDFGCHGMAKHWNSHWACSDFLWKIIKGRKTYLLNREPYSKHVNLHKRFGFAIIKSCKVQDLTGIVRKNLSHRFEDISDEDIVTRGAHILSVKQSGD